jgi:hypothetical protein
MVSKLKLFISFRQVAGSFQICSVQIWFDGQVISNTNTVRFGTLITFVVQFPFPNRLLHHIFNASFTQRSSDVSISQFGATIVLSGTLCHAHRAIEAWIDQSNECVLITKFTMFFFLFLSSSPC